MKFDPIQRNWHSLALIQLDWSPLDWNWIDSHWTEMDPIDLDWIGLELIESEWIERLSPSGLDSLNFGLYLFVLCL